MTTQPGDPFRLPRLSRARTLHAQDHAGWHRWLAQGAFVALMLFAIAGPWINNYGDDTLRHTREYGFAGVLVLALVATRPWRHPERLLVVPWPLILALGWCWVSLGWAFAPDAGLRRLVLTTIVLWSVFALVRELGLDRTVATLRVMMALLVVANFAVVLTHPEIGIMGSSEPTVAGAWQGLMAHKNWAGLACALTVLLFAFDAGRVAVAVRIGVAAAAVLFLVLTQSKTSMGIVVAALAVGGLLTWYTQRFARRRLAAPGWAWLPLIVVAGIVLSIAADPAFWFELASDPTDFTGRTQIWTAMIKLYGHGPWFGVGYGSVWDLGPGGGPLTPYAPGWIGQMSQGHNGYLDLLIQIGAVGVLLVVFATAVWPLQRLLRGGDHPVRTLGAAMLVFCLGHNFTESTLFDRDALGQVFLMIAIALLWGATAAQVAERPGAAGGGLPRRMRSAG